MRPNPGASGRGQQGDGEGQAGVRAQDADLHGARVWILKITSRMRAPAPAISPVRMLAIRVARRRRQATAGGGGAEPFAEGAAGYWLCRSEAPPVRARRYFLRGQGRWRVIGRPGAWRAVCKR
jgi:hypothetical protein